ncbi:MAG TPA: PorT family protein [Bacteroidales bacterium]|nr:PorT family protein [Bacteroidales bacterium]
MSHLRSLPRKDRRLLTPLLLTIGLLLGNPGPQKLAAQTLPVKQHMVGVKGGYAFNMIHFTPDRKQTSVPSWKNASVVYTYYHDLWGNLPYFGLQTGFAYTQQAYDTPQLKRVYEVVRIPLVSQFHIDMWKTRLLLNLGCFASYRMSAMDFTEEQPQGVPVVFDCNHISQDYGVLGGIGFALVLKPFEIHLEANYSHSFAMIENPALYSNEHYTYGYPGQLLFTIALYLHL